MLIDLFDKTDVPYFLLTVEHHYLCPICRKINVIGKFHQVFATPPHQINCYNCQERSYVWGQIPEDEEVIAEGKEPLIIQI